MTDKEIKHQPSCEDELNIGLLSVAEAQTRILDGVMAITATKKLPLREALGSVLAEDIISPINVPSHTNSAVDGYAIRAADLPAVQIMTGGVIPDGMDTVIMQEQVERDGDMVRIGTGHKAGQNVRAAGEDIATGQAVLAPGNRLTAADIGVLASLGLAEVSVYRRLKVAFFSTGDELRAVGEQLGPGEIHDSNRYTLYGMLKKLDVEIIDMGVVKDRRELVEQALKKAASSANVIITSGGVSVGEADFVKETLEKLGSISFWKIAMKPGRPVTFGKIDDAVFFGLPGNPVSVMVTFFQFVRPALLKMSGETDASSVYTVWARTTTALRKRPGRYEFQRGVLEQPIPGEFTVRSVGAQGSGILRSMSEANCFILLEPDQSSVEAGQDVLVQPFQNLI